MNQPIEKLLKICCQFQFRGSVETVAPFGDGHIHATYLVTCREGSREVRRYLLQRMNTQVFQRPVQVMENIERVTEHLRKKILVEGGDPGRGTITLIPGLEGKTYYHSEEDEYWRAEIFIEGTITCQQTTDNQRHYRAGKAFGQFQKYLGDLPPERLHVTLVDFHHTGKRYERFLQAVHEDTHRRAGSVAKEIGFARARAGEASRLVELSAGGILPQRVAHNDAKLDNILVDRQSGEAVCVIDLDTVMNGPVVFDFGDLVRSGANTAGEDEQNLRKVEFDLEIYEQIAGGYLAAVRDWLSPAEIEQLPFATRLITYEQGLRFLTDYLEGDRYYPIRRADHNLERCRVQFKLLAEMEKQREEMEARLRKLEGRR